MSWLTPAAYDLFVAPLFEVPHSPFVPHNALLPWTKTLVPQTALILQESQFRTWLFPARLLRKRTE